MSRIEMFNLTILPDYPHGDIRLVEMRIHTNLDHPTVIEKKLRIEKEFFESEIGMLMRLATEEIKSYMQRLKEDEKLRYASREEMEAHIRKKLEEPRKEV